MEKLQWNKKILGSVLELTRGTETIGSIQWQNMLSGKASAWFFGRNFLLTRDYIPNRIDIYDGKDQSLLGRLAVNAFNPHSEIVINGKRFELEMKNFWQSRWSWKFNGTEIITFTSSEFLTRDKGEIELFSACNEEVEILILLGLSLRNYFVLLILVLLLVIVIVMF